MAKKRARQPNTTTDGGLACAYGSPWLDHFGPPLGTGKGCIYCDRINRTGKMPKRQPVGVTRSKRR